jgi:hypothetical protein
VHFVLKRADKSIKNVNNFILCYFVTEINISNVLATIQLFECLRDLISFHDAFLYLKVCRNSHVCPMVNIFRSSFRVYLLSVTFNNFQAIARPWD